jgi:hypothetical protein
MNRQVQTDMYVITVKQSGCERACMSSYFIEFVGEFAKFKKSTTSFVMSACLSVRMEQLGSQWTDFHEIFEFDFLSKIRRENLSSMTSR